MLRAIDHHNALHFHDNDPWHLDKAEKLRQYVRELKTWIHRTEAIQSSNRLTDESESGMGENGVGQGAQQ